MCVRVHVHVSEYTQRPKVNVWCLPRLLSTLHWRQNLSLKLKLTDPATLTGQQAHGLLLCLSCTGIGYTLPWLDSASVLGTELNNFDPLFFLLV